ncbi:kinesin-like protein KIF19 isoform X1 [Balaenoptera acutorostrata]|uniref:Kinesin-like protein n=1 Tax=Balaenoptera acutorostrata TaxID=9767 RepID=A0ABM3S8P3_BALAC|nr:kinesin-like protein KIF19 isoform X1 [Balaenoptera acutorostrata]
MLRMDAGPGIYLQMLTDLFQAVEETRESTDCSVSVSCLETTQLLTRGNWQRTQESTATSKMSSRSHAVLQVTVHQRSHGTDMAEEVHIGRLSMVDLAGSELAPQTQNRGKRMKEGAPINRSLLALGNCINALSEKGRQPGAICELPGQQTHARLLKLAPSTEQDALGGNSRMATIAHISPASTHFEESRATLPYAYRARNIKRRVKRNLLNVSYHIAQYADVISDLGRQIKHPKAKVEKQEKEKRSIPEADMLKAGLEQRLANAKKKASPMEQLPPTQVVSKDSGRRCDCLQGPRAGGGGHGTAGQQPVQEEPAVPEGLRDPALPAAPAALRADHPGPAAADSGCFAPSLLPGLPQTAASRSAGSPGAAVRPTLPGAGCRHAEPPAAAALRDVQRPARLCAWLP